MKSSTPADYSTLTPDTLLDAVDACGYQTDGRLLALNSYENRVYQVGMEEGPPLVVKFYRPGRWDDACILEEHAFSLALAVDEIPVIAPLVAASGDTLLHFEGFRFTLFPRQGGRWPDLDSPENLERIGRLLGRIHMLGSARPFAHRPTLDPQEMGTESSHFLIANGFIPLELESRYRQLTEGLQRGVERQFDAVSGYRRLRLHGDCHPGNILWTDGGPHFVDLDDCRNGPAIQDLWMLLSGSRLEMARQLSHLRAGYQTFRDLDPREIALIEALRTLRMIHYAAWIARRWHDPAFPTAFPWFNTHAYWQDHLAQLEQQQAALENPPLPLY
jgi:Ser/Thr protein kinase RdoA (MazF antagonist)